MQQMELLHTILKKSQAVKHKTRLDSLLKAVESVTNGSDLSLTSLGRHLNKPIQPRSKIQEMEYLLGNGHLHVERLAIFTAVNEWMIGEERQLFIAIDWSTLVPHAQHVLRASLIRKGRSMTVYEEIHPESRLGQSGVHQTFLKHLKQVLPKHCEICLIVDAGFRTDFFVQVETTDWDYVGRILSNMKYSGSEQTGWVSCSDVYEAATEEPQALGTVKLSKTNQLASHLYLYKKIAEGSSQDHKTHVKTVKYGRKEKEYRNTAKKPWLIASSLTIPAATVMALYGKRMKIEHDFRDTKDPKWGLGLRASRSKDPMRLIIQLLIGYLAAFVLWLIGLCLEDKKLHLHFQANSIKHKRVLSLVFLALEAIRSGYMRFIHEKDFLKIKKRGLQDDILSGQIL